MRHTVLLLTVALLVGCGALDVPTDGTGRPPQASIAATPTIHPDAAAYADAFEVSIHEASRRLARSDAIDRLQAVLQTNEPAFVSLQLQHEPDYRIIANFTGASTRPLDEYVAGTDLADLIDLRRVRYTLDDLLRIRDAAQRALDSAGVRTNAYIDEGNNRVVVDVYYRERLDRALAAAGVTLPNGAVVVAAPPPVPYIDPDVVPTPLVESRVRHFPQQLPPDGMRASMDALLEGELVLVDGCLRVAGGATSVLIIWPPDVVLDAAADPIALRDLSGKVVARVGERIALGGGGGLEGDVDPETVGAWLRDLDASCRGPYFVASDLTE